MIREFSITENYNNTRIVGKLILFDEKDFRDKIIVPTFKQSLDGKKIELLEVSMVSGKNFWTLLELKTKLKETNKKEIIKEIEKWMVGRLPAFPPKGKAKEIFKMKLFSAEDIKAFLNKL